MKKNKMMLTLPPSELPYEKCQRDGPGALSDAELLAVILRTGTRKQTSVEVAKTLLKKYGSRAGLTCLMTLSGGELQKIDGIGPVKAVELLAVAELCRRIVRSSKRPSVSLRDPSSIAAYFMEDMCYLPQEEMRVAMFDTRNRLLHEMVLSMGTVNASLASPRELFLEALRYGAVYLVLLHNHPSGDPTPSEADIRLTTRMASAGDLLHIPVMDHIVIGDHSYYSMREEGHLPYGGQEII